jgi:hypothetical protein
MPYLEPFSQSLNFPAFTTAKTLENWWVSYYKTFLEP